MTMLSPDVRAVSCGSVHKRLGVRPYVVQPLPPSDRGRGEVLPGNFGTLSAPVRTLQRMSSLVQTAALLSALWFGVLPFAKDRVAPSVERRIEQIVSDVDGFVGDLDSGKFKSVQELSYEEVDMVADGMLRLFDSVSFDNLRPDSTVAAKIKAFNAVYQKGWVSSALRRYQELYYKKYPENVGILDYLNPMIRVIEGCEERGVSARECVRSFRQAIYDNRHNIDGMWNMRETDVMPPLLEEYLSDEPLDGRSSGSVVWDRRRIKSGQVLRAKRLWRDQESAYRHRQARRLRM